MNRQGVDGVDGRESPALASSPHHSPRPRAARRGGAHAPPRACLRGSPAQTIAALRRSCVLRSELLGPRWFERRSGSLKPRATNTLRFDGRSDSLASSALLKPTPSATALEVCHGTERCCARIGGRRAVVRCEDGREVPLHDTSRDLPPNQPLPVALHQGWPEGSVRPRGARSLDEEGGEVWLCGSAAASGTSGR
jgi:hypothetical protein